MTDALPSNMKILVIDDEQYVSRALRRTLAGEEVLMCASGFEGLATFARERPDVVLCDLNMPAMDGYEVIRRIKRLSPATVCFLLTGSFAVPDCPHVEGVIEKPWRPDLRERIESAASQAKCSSRASAPAQPNTVS